ncbi:FAD-dependent oxidoreductase [uncultured Maribacter sp.]|uniref:flavin monoamine oxidase family protein n=1 Tax=uncultured Maribacter sp. TaxID=431308 RepID=UPI00260EA075|nr:FAD-dependent oxidoreductase [uncultured Maribacter sp.]
MKNKNISPKINRRDMLKKTSVFLAVAPFYFGLHSCINSGKKSFDADVIVIGAGLSGLNAALILEESGFRVKIVEATNRIGGRVFSLDDKIVPGHPELGGNGIGGGYARILNAAKKYNLEMGPFRPRSTPRKKESYFHINNKNILEENWTNHAMNPFPKGFKKGFPSSQQWGVYQKLNPLPKNDLVAWRKKEFKKWDKSIYTILKENGFSDKAIHLTAGTNSAYGTDEHSLSAMMYFQILNFINHQSTFKDSGGGVVKGNQRIPEAMAADFNQDIVMKSPVKAIIDNKDHVKISLENDKTMRARYVIATLPTPALRRISISSFSNQIQQKGINELCYTPNLQIHFIPTENYWEKDGLPPSIWSDQRFGRFMAMKNDPKNPNKVTSCVAYIAGNQALEISKLGKKKGISQVLKILEKIRPSLKGTLKFAHYWSWINNPYAGGSYAYWKPGQITSYANEFAKPNGRIHFAGEHTAVMMRGMEGAMESGERAAFDIMNLL